MRLIRLLLAWVIPCILVHAAPSMEEVIEVMPASDYKGGCSPEQTQLLQDQWAQMQESAWITYNLVAHRPQSTLPEVTRGALSSFMGIWYPSKYSQKLEGLHMTKTNRAVQLWKDVFADLMGAIEIQKGGYKKRQLYCNSDALEYIGPETVLPKPKSSSTKGRQLKSETWYNPKDFYWRLDSLRDGPGLSNVEKPTDEKGEVELDATPEPMCSNEAITAYAISGQTFRRIPWIDNRANDVLILCPHYFTQTRDEYSENTNTNEVLNTLPFGEGCPFSAGEKLVEWRPNWLTLYTEIIGLRIGHTIGFDKVWTQEMIAAPLGEEANDPDDWVEGDYQVQTPKQCFLLAEHDRNTVASAANSKAMRSPENSAWFSLALLLWIESQGHESWNSGTAVATEDALPAIPPLPDTMPQNLRGSRAPGAKKVKNEDPDPGSKGKGSAITGKTPSSGGKTPGSKGKTAAPKGRKRKRPSSDGDGSGEDNPGGGSRPRLGHASSGDAGEGPSRGLRPRPQRVSHGGHDSDPGHEGSSSGGGSNYDPNDNPNDPPTYKGKGKAPDRSHRPDP